MSTAFAEYELMHLETGTALYTTFATEVEILQANANLHALGLPSRFFPTDTFSIPSLHS